MLCGCANYPVFANMVESIPDEAEPAWDAYLEMGKSKQAHFNMLETLESKYQEGGRASFAEEAQLRNLLAEHNERVQSFRRLTKALQTTDLVAYEALIQQITLINTQPGPDNKPV